MNAKDIRALPVKRRQFNEAIFLREIAAQLAERNELAREADDRIHRLLEALKPDFVRAFVDRIDMSGLVEKCAPQMEAIFAKCCEKMAQESKDKERKPS